MKNHFLLLVCAAATAVLLGTAQVSAQTSKPKDFLLVPASASVSVANGQSAQLNLGLPRAGFFKKDVIKLKANHDVQGLTVQIDPTDALADAVIKISAQGVAPGTYGITLMGTSGVVTRGTTVQVVVQ
jgi:hypothetical protein